MSQLDRLNPKAHLALTWSFVPLIVFFFIGMIPMSGFIPPPSPMNSAAEILAFYTSHVTALRLGLVVSALSFTLMFGWGAAIAVWTGRIEKGFPVLTYTQLVCCSGGSALTFVIFLVWSVASLFSARSVRTSRAQRRTSKKLT